MPILAENKHRYPKDWKLRSLFIRQYRAKNRCEWCGVRNYSVGFRGECGIFKGCRGTAFHDLAGQGLFFPSCEPLNYKTARFIADELNQNEFDETKYIVIVLTVAHVYDHRPEAASFLNLAALCQKCHNDHDAKMRRSNAKRRREERQLQLTLN